jgi:cell division protein FtsI (penicillin-binding protein 3)
MMLSHRMRRNAVKIEGEKSSALDLARGRLVLLSVVFTLIFLVYAVRAFDLTIIQGRAFAVDDGSAAQEEKHANAKKKKRRADIVDRNGVLLATTIETASLYADAKLISNPKSAAEGLVKIFPDLSYGDILQKLQSGKRFVWINRGLSPEQQYQVLGLGEPGLEFEQESQRFYPQGELVSHFVGFSNVDAQGLAGTERSFDNILAKGQNIKLTIDVRLQHALHREVARAIDEFSAPGGAGVIMDVNTGEVLAGVSLPDFNPHQAGVAKDNEVFNRLTLGTYELGSVFKIFSTAAFFETHDVGMSTTFDASEPLRVGRFSITDYHAQDRAMTIPEVFMYSSNIGSALMGQAVGTERLKSFYQDLGLITPMEFEIREIAPPQIANPWREINTLTASYGHGLATTPLQLVSAVSSVVNGGYLVKPTLVVNEEGAEETVQPEMRVLSTKTSERMRELMRLVVTEGTGTKADVKGYRVGGKTGTADKNFNGRYDHKKKISSFIGVFPMDDPKYAIFVMVDEPNGTKATYGYATGGWVAAPAVSRIIASMVSVLGIAPVHEDAPENQFGSGLKQYVSIKGGDH